jgi:salicylate hydroxylase
MGNICCSQEREPLQVYNIAKSNIVTMAPSLEVALTAQNDHNNGRGLSNGVKKPAQHIEAPIHPTRSLQFLQKLYPESRIHERPPLQATVKLRVIIVGGGLGGLACAIALARRGHTITVLEQANQLGEVGR